MTRRQGTYPKIASSTSQLLVDRIVYLASLVSDPTAVDSMLDTLRLITARMRPSVALSDIDEAALHTLELKLKHYLVHSDPVRSFTTASLEKSLDKYFNSNTHSTRIYTVKLQLITVAGIVLVSYVCAVLLGHGTQRSLLTMSPVPLTLLNFGIAWFFWSARHDYAHDIRTMYGYFSTGVIIRSIALAQFPILLAVPHLRRHAFFHYVGFLPPFILMSIIFYWGMVLYTRQLKLKTPLGSPFAILGGAALLSIIVFLTSHPAKAPDVLFFNVSLASFLLSAYFSIPAAVSAFTVARHITPRYALSMKLLAVSQILFAVGCLCFSTVLIIVAGPLTNGEIGLSALSFVAPEILLLLSAFNAKRAVNEIS